MLQPFLQFNTNKKLFIKKDKILLAVSGGIDSVVMVHLFKEAGFKFAIVHCNFRLRAKASDADEMFVAALANKYNVTYFIERFNTEEYAGKNKLSIQMAARELRYAFFERIRKQYGFAYIATAHHATDNAETILINLLRGGGLAATKGIAVKNKKIIRPLLFATRSEIENYAANNGLKWREDASNQSDNYIRNKIRHHVLPVLREINPSLENAFFNHARITNEVLQVYEKYIEEVRNKVCTKEKNVIIIDSGKLKALDEPPSVWFDLLRPFNFNSDAINLLYSSKLKQTGKHLFSATHQLTINRNQYLITPLQKLKHVEIEIESTGEYFLDHLAITISNISINTYKSDTMDGKNKNQSVGYFDATQLSFPLIIRQWKRGDYFYPLGMKGKKLLSDFFTDKKFSSIQKEKQFLLLSNHKIAWVLGERSSEAFKVSASTKKIIKIEVSLG